MAVSSKYLPHPFVCRAFLYSFFVLFLSASLRAERAHILWTRGGSVPSNVSVAYSPDGRLTASGGDAGDPVLRLWTASDGSLLREVAADSVQDLAFSPDSKFI